jgi:hypothetical protein
VRTATFLLLLTLAGASGACSDDGEGSDPGGAGERSPAAPATPDQSRETTPAAPGVPDGGVPEGHGADDAAPPPRERGSIVVPDADRTPPRPVVRLAGARATLYRSGPPVLVAPDEPFVVKVVGRDRDGGMGRARVAISARLTCRDAGGALSTKPFVRYVPPPQIARVRIAPGTRTRTELSRTVVQSFGNAECEGDTLARFTGQAWADTTNASGLDATSKHIHFASP